MGAKRPRHRSRPEAAARTGTRRGACGSAGAGHGLSVSPAATPTGYAPGRSPGSRAGGQVLPATPAFPCRMGTVASRGRAARLQLRGQRRCCTGFPFQSDRSDHHGAFPADGRAPYAACRSASTAAGTPEKKTPRLRRRERGAAHGARPAPIRFRRNRPSVDAAGADFGASRCVRPRPTAGRDGRGNPRRSAPASATAAPARSSPRSA